MLGVLTGGARSAPAPPRTLRATLDWSHDLLTQAERAVFRRLSVFAGGFTLAAARVGRRRLRGHSRSWSVLDLLTKLADKSLLRVDPVRRLVYQLLAIIREYAREQLAASDDADRAVRPAYLSCYTSYAEGLGHCRRPRLAVPGGDPLDLESVLDRMDAKEAELPNGTGRGPAARRPGGGTADLRGAGPVRVPARSLRRGPALADGRWPSRRCPRWRITTRRPPCGHGPSLAAAGWRTCSATTARPFERLDAALRAVPGAREDSARGQPPHAAGSRQCRPRAGTLRLVRRSCTPPVCLFELAPGGRTRGGERARLPRLRVLAARGT